ncbi:hypothetical protein L1987_27993 [Smallanthus sonchifolius]|uniref:Uncharacterized protein n=1 Tax=Smallanthus sonchifolius TaxID=185202 RepID=A0ACB9IC64_9ASTR|nr:hypothetical protein L1987_27993 [Smallanthus sonchifolius]
MSSTTTNPPYSNYSLRSILDKEKLNGFNFIDWHRNLRIVLKADKILDVLENLIPDQPAATATQAVRKTWEKHVDDSSKVSCIMLETIVPKLENDMEDLTAYDMTE